MTIPEQAVEAALEAWHKVVERHDYNERNGMLDALTAAMPLVGVEQAALPPREEIAGALAKPITGFPFDMLLEEQQAELLKAADAVRTLLAEKQTGEKP